MSSLDLESLKAALRELLNKPGTMTRAEHSKLTPRDAAAFFRHGGRLTDRAEPAESPRLAILNQSQFSKLSAKDRSDYVRFGGLVRDNSTPAPTPRPAPAKSKPEPIDFND